MFQSYYGLDLTGRLDDMTMSAVHTPRFSHTNIFLQVAKYFYWTWQVHGDGPGESVGREEPGGQLQPPQQVGPGQVQDHVSRVTVRVRWDKNKLTWRVTKFPSNDLSDDLVIATMERAFSVWEKHADLKFFQTDSGVGDIEIRSWFPLKNIFSQMSKYFPAGGRVGSTGTGTRLTSLAARWHTPSSRSRAAPRGTSTLTTTSSGHWAASKGSTSHRLGVGLLFVLHSINPSG